MQTSDYILKIREVCELIKLSKATVYRLEAARKFPQRVKLSARAVGWKSSAVMEWLANRETA